MPAATIGLTTKDYLLTSLALFQADAIYRNQKGTAEFKNSVNPENLLFVRKHRREVNRAVREIETLNMLKERQENTGKVLSSRKE